MNIKMCEKEFSRLGFRLFICALLINGTQIVGQYIGMLVNREWAQNMDIMLAWMMIPMYAVGYPLAFWVLGRHGDKRVIAKHRMKPAHFILAFMMSYALLMGGNIIGLAVTAVIGFVKGEPVANNLNELVSGGNLWILAVYVVILAPICEEILFRKLLCDRVVKYGQGMAVAISGITFGLAHGNFNQFFYAFFIGCFFAFIYMKTGNVKYTIGLHMIVNFIGSVVGGLLVREVDLTKPTNSDMVIYAVYLLFIFGIVIAGAVLFLVNLSRFKLQSGEITIAKGSRFVTVVVNAGMGLYFIAFILLMAAQALLL